MINYIKASKLWVLLWAVFLIGFSLLFLFSFIGSTYALGVILILVGFFDLLSIIINKKRGYFILWLKYSQYKSRVDKGTRSFEDHIASSKISGAVFLILGLVVVAHTYGLI